MTLYPASAFVSLVQQKLDAADDAGALAVAISGRDAHPTDPAIWRSLGLVHMHANRLAGALLPLYEAERLSPGDIETWLVLAEVHNRRDDWFESERYYRKVLAADPDNLTALVNLEPIIREQRHFDEVRDILARVRRLMPALDQAVTCSLGCLDLLQGNLNDGFQGYESRIEGFSHLREAYGTPYFPRWDGRADLAGKTILIRFEQGLGDTIQYIRFAAALKQRGAVRLDVLCKAVLHRLVCAVPGVDGALEALDDRAWDFEVMMMSMPALLGVACEADLPGDPYVMVRPEDISRWAPLLDERGQAGRPNVGVVWSGELKLGQWYTERMNLRRSIRLDLLRPIFDVPCNFYALQKGPRQADLRQFPTPYPIHDLMDRCVDFYDTASLTRALDLVIAVDTSTAHAAAATGAEVWMLNRYDGCWRWLLDRTDTPWYRSMTVFNQTEFCNWRPIIYTLQGRLASYAKQFSNVRKQTQR